MRAAILILILGMLVISVPPASAGDCVDAPDGTICYGDNTFQDGSCSEGGYEVDVTGLLVWLPGDSFLFVGGFDGCTGEGGMSHFSQTGTQGQVDGPLGVWWNAGHYEESHADGRHECDDVVSIEVATPVGTQHGVDQRRPCSPGTFPTPTWGDVEPEP